MRIGSHRVMLAILRPSLPSLRETVSSQPPLPFREKLCHLRGYKTAEARVVEGHPMTFDDVLAQIIDLLQREKRVSYRALKRRFALDDEYLEDLKADLVEAKRLAVDEDGKVLVWTGGIASA